MAPSSYVPADNTIGVNAQAAYGYVTVYNEGSISVDSDWVSAGVLALLVLGGLFEGAGVSYWVSAVEARLCAGELSVDRRHQLASHAAVCASCREVISCWLAPPAATADRVGRYELERMLGQGATGVVYAARDPELGRRVALKLLRPGARAARLRREAQLLAQLDHPNVVDVVDNHYVGLGWCL